jgi:hypothetical protein
MNRYVAFGDLGLFAFASTAGCAGSGSEGPQGEPGKAGTIGASRYRATYHNALTCRWANRGPASMATKTNASPYLQAPQPMGWGSKESIHEQGNAS